MFELCDENSLGGIWGVGGAKILTPALESAQGFKISNLKGDRIAFSLKH